MSVQRRKLTGFGVKPMGQVQWRFLYRWLHGAIEPLSGEVLMLEFSHLDSVCFERFLVTLAHQFPNDLHLVQVDNAKAHTAQSLTLPDNVVLLFQPPYCPEVNPIERLWQELERYLQWKQFNEIEALQQAMTLWCQQLSQQAVRSLTQWGWLVDALCVAGI